MPDDRLHAAPPAARAGLFECLADTVRDTQRLVVDHLELAALEAQGAANGLVRVMIAAIVVTVLVVAAWTAAVAGAAIWATRAGMSLSWALLCAGVANLVAAVAIGAWIHARLPNLMFAATLRQLRTDKETLLDESERHSA